MKNFFISISISLLVAVAIVYYLRSSDNVFDVKSDARKLTSSQSVTESPMILSPGIKLKMASGTVSNESGNKEKLVESNNYDFYNILATDKTQNKIQDMHVASQTNNQLNQIPPNNKNMQNQVASQPTKSVVKKPSIYYVQAGAFADANRANNLKAKLLLLGYDPTLRTEAGNVRARVILGPYLSEDEALKIINDLLKQSITSVLLKISQ